MGNLMNIPEIRFPEFKYNWDHKELNDFLTLSLNPISKPKENYLSIGITGASSVCPRDPRVGRYKAKNHSWRCSVFLLPLPFKEQVQNYLLMAFRLGITGASSVSPRDPRVGRYKAKNHS